MFFFFVCEWHIFIYVMLENEFECQKLWRIQTDPNKCAICLWLCLNSGSFEACI